jgi:hypothetical protein
VCVCVCIDDFAKAQLYKIMREKRSPEIFFRFVPDCVTGRSRTPTRLHQTHPVTQTHRPLNNLNIGLAPSMLFHPFLPFSSLANSSRRRGSRSTSALRTIVTSPAADIPRSSAASPLNSLVSRHATAFIWCKKSACVLLRYPRAPFRGPSLLSSRINGRWSARHLCIF